MICSPFSVWRVCWKYCSKMSVWEISIKCVWGWWEVSAGKGIWYQIHQHAFDPQYLYKGGKREAIPPSCLLTSTWTHIHHNKNQKYGKLYLCNLRPHLHMKNGANTIFFAMRDHSVLYEALHSAILSWQPVDTFVPIFICYLSENRAKEMKTSLKCRWSSYSL